MKIVKQGMREILLIYSVLLLFITGCPGGPGNLTEVAGIELSLALSRIYCGMSEQLIPIIDPSNATNQNLKWSSSNKSVVTVADGLITGVAAGVAAVTAETEDGSFTASCSVAVYDAPTVTTAEMVDSDSDINAYTLEIGGTSAKGGGEVTSEGGLPVVERGLCWNTAGSPTINDPHTADGEGFGTFTDTGLTDLSENTLYSVRAYAETGAGVVYGDEVVFNSGRIFGSDYAGGYVYYNDGEGGGYVAAKNDQSAGQIWSDVTNESVSDVIDWTTFWNWIFTAGLVTDQGGHTESAALVCLDYTDGTYDDWFLASANTMVQMSEKLYNPSPAIYNFGGTNYWSITQTSASTAARIDMSSGSISETELKGVSNYVRASRRF